MNGADVAWLSVSTLLVLMMAVPGLALFYAGMVRAKNTLSVLLQTLTVFSLGVLLWFVYGYSLAFTEGNAFFGGWSRVFLRGIFDPATGEFAMTGSIPEISFAAFQATFAGLTCALVVGSLVERIRFSAVLLFTVVWFTFCYVPIAHMVWYVSDGSSGLLAAAGALDFAGGTVVHINAGVAGLVGAYLVGARIGYGKEPIRPHNLPLTFTGAMLLWVGWFGFNAGSALAANTTAALAFYNTMVATAAGVIAWLAAEWIAKGRPSLLGGSTGAIAALVGITPGAGLVGPGGALIIGVLTSLACVWAVHSLKRAMRADDSLDVFFLHGVGGIVGAVLVGVFNAQVLGGPGLADARAILPQLWTQVEGVLLTIVWSGIVAALAYGLCAVTTGLRVSEDIERDGLDIGEHGESAYAP